MRREDRDRADADFVEFMSTHEGALIRLGYFLTGSTDQARELAQEALVRAYDRWPNIRRDGALAYTRRVVVNLRTDRARRWFRERPTDAVVDRPTAAGGDVEDRDEVVTLLARLPERQRKVVVLRYCCDLSEKEVASIMGISVGAVKSQASRGLAALREPSLSPEGDTR